MSLDVASFVIVKRGGLLGGTGTVNGPVTLETGAQITPGFGPGLESLDGLTVAWNSDNATAGMKFDLSASDNTSDVLTLTGAWQIFP